MAIFCNIKRQEGGKLLKITNNKLVQGFIATLLGSGLSKVILVVATFVSSNMLGKMAFGELSFVRNTLNMILCICALNFSALCTKFTTEAKSSEASLHRLFLLIFFSLAVCILMGGLLLLTPKWLLLKLFSTELIVKFFKITAILLPLFMLQPLVEGVLRGLKRFEWIGLLQTFSSLFYLIAIACGIHIGGLGGALVSVVLYYALYSIASLITLHCKYDVREYLKRLGNVWSERQSLYTMILPVFILSFIDAPVMWCAQVILSKQGTMESVGSMTAMLQIRNLAMLIPSYFTNTYLAFASDLNSQKNYKDYYRQFGKITWMYFLIGSALFIFISLLSRPILFLYGKEFVSDWPAMIISNIGIPLTMLVGLFRMDLLLKDHQRYLLLFSVIWNAVWIISLYVMTYLRVNPLYSFFGSQNIGGAVFIILLLYVYTKEKKVLLK